MGGMKDYTNICGKASPKDENGIAGKTANYAYQSENLFAKDRDILMNENGMVIGNRTVLSSLIKKVFYLCSPKENPG